MLTLALLIVTLAPLPAAADKPSTERASTLNKDQSDAASPPRGDATEGDRGAGGGRRGYGGGGRGYGGGRGGYGGRGMGRGGMRGAAVSPDEMARMRDAIRDLTDPSDHLTITQTDSIIVVTGTDGRTTRL